MSARVVDEAVTEVFLSAVSPAKIEIALRALEELETTRQEACRQWTCSCSRQTTEWNWRDVATNPLTRESPGGSGVGGALGRGASPEERLKQQYSEFQRHQDQTMRDQDRLLIKDLSMICRVCGRRKPRRWQNERHCCASWSSAFIWME